MATNHSPYDHQFHKLMEIQREGNDGEEDPLFTELLRHGAGITEALSQFIIRQPEKAELSVLIRLLGKCMDDRASAVVMNFLKSKIVELRLSAANALGWNRARAALEVLDEMEAGDPDPRVREEARAALDEILRDYPNLGSMLRNHRPIVPATGDQEFQTLSAPNHQQRLDLMAALPRLLSVKYMALPLHIAPARHLHLAVRSGSERRLIAPLEELTGFRVNLTGWPAEKIMQGIEQLYTLGDADFCTFQRQLRPLARTEIKEIIMAGIRQEEPACPLDEANDAVEAAQAFLASLPVLDAREVTITYQPPAMEIRGTHRRGGEFTIEPPGTLHRERFLAVLRILAGVQDSKMMERRGTILLPDALLEVGYNQHTDVEILTLIRSARKS